MKILAIFTITLSLMAGAVASPGAHGPNGEHLDGQASAGTVGNAPQVETFSEMFELVGQLSRSEFSVVIDRYETNEPVLNGKLEVEYKGQKAIAKFHADIGDYKVDDKKFLKALASPGKHALTFTFIAGDESDLLEGTLEVSAPPTDEHPHTPYWQWIALALAAIAAIAVAFFLRHRSRKSTL